MLINLAQHDERHRATHSEPWYRRCLTAADLLAADGEPADLDKPIVPELEQMLDSVAISQEPAEGHAEARLDRATAAGPRPPGLLVDSFAP